MGLLPTYGPTLAFPSGQIPSESSMLACLPVKETHPVQLSSLSVTLVSHNIGAIADPESKNDALGVMAYPGKLSLLGKQYAARGAHLVGLQEARSRKGGVNKVGAFLRYVPQVDSPAGKDVELWVKRFQDEFGSDPTAMFEEPASRAELNTWRKRWIHCNRPVRTAAQATALAS